MKNFFAKLIIALNLLFGVGQVFVPAIVFAQTVDIDFGDQDDLKDLEMANKVKQLILGFLCYMICPVLGVATGVKGWQMISNAERGDKGTGAWVLICGAVMTVLPAVMLQLYKHLSTTAA
ncbi:MAG: hypothetical protein EOP04_02300 [Proteobacteria bacterium]|nr:MAG: hypothetical protein EOP04_02300 [Pseudomonadota bacterium]